MKSAPWNLFSFTLFIYLFYLFQRREREREREDEGKEKKKKANKKKIGLKFWINEYEKIEEESILVISDIKFIFKSKKILGPNMIPIFTLWNENQGKERGDHGIWQWPSHQWGSNADVFSYACSLLLSSDTCHSLSILISIYKFSTKF